MVFCTLKLSGFSRRIWFLSIADYLSDVIKDSRVISNIDEVLLVLVHVPTFIFVVHLILSEVAEL